MFRISASVGRNAKNVTSDVLLTQRLLNGSLHVLIPFAPLPEDGVATAALSDLISAFQQRMFHTEKPDGRIDPGGTTWVRLVQVTTVLRPRPANVQSFLDMAAPAARRVQQTWKVPASVLLAQAAQESGWGAHVKGNAYFGIKGTTGTSGGIAFATTEVIGGETKSITDTFRAYKNFEEAADGYGQFLNENPKYKNAFTFTSDPLRFVDEVAKAGYATDPNYAANVKRIITSFHLTEYDK